MREVAAELRAARCCCSAAARTRSCCCAWPRRRSARRASRSRSCTSTPGHNFPEVIEFRDRRVAELGERLIVASRAGLDRRRPRGRGDRPARVAQPPADDDAARRDRRARLRRRLRRRAPRRGARARQGAHLLASATTSAAGTRKAPAPRAVEPLQRRASARASTSASSRCRNWTELDVWQYIEAEDLEVPSIYFAHEREVFRRDGMLYAVSPHVRAHRRRGALRRVACATARSATCRCTGAVASTATALDDVVAEIAATTITERGETRADDRVSEAAMEDRKVRRLLLRGYGTLLLATCCASRPPARSTTASRRSSAACCTTPRRSSPTSSTTCAARDGELDLSRLTDGLRAEREQGITIDVAYRYFATAAALVHPGRHARATCSTRATWSPAPRPPTWPSCSSTRATAWSSRRAATRSSRRCSASPTSSSRSTRWTSSTTPRRPSTRSCATSAPSRAQLGVRDIAFVPLSALHGDNVVERSEAMPWYGGLPLLEHLETRRDRRRPQPRRRCASRCSTSSATASSDYRGYAGQVAGGVAAPGRRGASCCPPARTTTVAVGRHLDGPLDAGVPADERDRPPRPTTSTSRAAT